MTKYQEKALERLQRMVQNEANALNGRHGEIKRWEVTDCEYFISLAFEFGRIGDEGTLAEIFCRDHGQVFIGKKGGITYPVHKKLKSGEYKHYEKRFNGIVLSVVCDQRV